MKTIPNDLGNSESSKVQKFLQPNHSSAGMLSKMKLFAQMSVRDVNISPSLTTKLNKIINK